MDLFVFAAYGLATVVVAAYASSVVRRHRQVDEQLEDLENPGASAIDETVFPSEE